MILWVRNLGMVCLGWPFFHIVLVVISWWYSARGYVGLEGDTFSHMSGAFAWMAGKLGSVGPLI